MAGTGATLGSRLGDGLTARNGSAPALHDAARLALIVALALAARLAYARVVAPDTGDSASFFALARSLVAGHGLAPVDAPSLPSFERPPAYPLFIAAVWRVAGERVGALVAAQALVDSVAAAVLFAFARLRFGLPTAWLAAIAYALLPFAAGQSLQILSEFLAGFCVIVAAWSHQRALQTPARAASWSALAGVAWGLAALSRPYLAPLCAPAAVLVAWELRPRARQAALGAALALCATASATIGLWAARNLYWARRLHVPFVVFQPLGSRAPYTTLFTPGFLAWMRSHEEPMIWPTVDEAPLSPYLDDAERQRTRALFAEVRAHADVVTPALDGRFAALADARYRQAPLRLYVWRPLSVALKYWLSPHLSTVGQSSVGAPGQPAAGRALRWTMTALSALMTLLFAAGVLVQPRAAGAYPAVLAATLTVVLVAIGLNESRYLMPLWTLVCAGVGRALVRLRPRLRAAEPTS